MTVVTTATIAHLPMIALVRLFPHRSSSPLTNCQNFLQALATPTNPDPPRPSRLQVATIIILIYIYGAIPLAPAIAAGEIRYPEGFGEWWGFYCVDKNDSRKPVRLITLAAPAIFTLVLCFFIISTLYSCIGSLPYARATWLKWGHCALYTLCAGGTVAYIIIEAVIGWYADWWPRAFERKSAPTGMMCIAHTP